MSTSDLLVTPAQRDRAVEILQEMYADGRLTHPEFDARLELALKSRTRAELNGSFDGLLARPIPTYAPAAFTRPAPIQRYDGNGEPIKKETMPQRNANDPCYLSRPIQLEEVFEQETKLEGFQDKESLCRRNQCGDDE